jgi:2'-5' RNA ligase
MGKLYFALQLDADATEEIAGLAADIAFEYDLSGPYAAEWLHLSLNGVGLFTPDLADRAIRAGDSIWAPPVEVVLERIERYGGEPAPLVLAARETTALRGLFDLIAKAMTENGLGAANGFSPHVTLLRDNQAPSRMSLAAPIGWLATHFLLIHSADGHEVVASWPLQG